MTEPKKHAEHDVPSESASAGISDDKKAELAAVRLLARREHGVEELRRKLIGKGHPQDAVERVITKLQVKSLVSDDRYASTLTRHQAKRGQGPVRIRAQLRQQGLSEELVADKVTSASNDWAQLAIEARRRKFGNSLPKTAAERAKQARFLQYRGFNADQIRVALKSGADFDFPDGSADTDSI
jgi:regulatory protein